LIGHPVGVRGATNIAKVAKGPYSCARTCTYTKDTQLEVPSVAHWVILNLMPVVKRHCPSEIGDGNAKLVTQLAVPCTVKMGNRKCLPEEERIEGR
jgi:hypothetical protein